MSFVKAKLPVETINSRMPKFYNVNFNLYLNGNILKKQHNKLVITRNLKDVFNCSTKNSI